MDRVKHKSKKDKQQKHADKDNTSSFITDVKSIKENLKIKEILRTVKMNSSMRIKAPRGSKVMNNKDFNDIDDLFEENNKTVAVDHQLAGDEPSPSATNCDVILNAEDTKRTKTDEIVMGLETDKVIQNEQEEPHQNHTSENDNLEESSTDVEYEVKPSDDVLVIPEIKSPVDNPHLKNRDRKLSLDQTMLRRQEGLSQSELDLYSIGKSPLERKSSFFRKKMESFFKNTTEIFKRQSMSSKPESVQRRGSMSVSLQSLNEKSSEYNSLINNKQGSSRSLRSSSTVGQSTSSLTASQVEAGMSEAGSLAGSQPLLSASQPLAVTSADSVQNLNEACAQESMLNSRAISMSSGLDSAHVSRRRRSNSSRANRVTWLASEGLAHYFRRLIQDEKSTEMQVCHSYSDFTTIPENELSGPRVDCKGRRLSYQRAVSGEDPVVPSRYDHSARRRGHIPEHEVSTATRTVSGEDPVVPSRYDHSARRRGLKPEHEVSTATRTVSGEDPVVPSRYDHSARRRGLIPEHEVSTATRTVSGEDPVVPSRYDHSARRRGLIPEHEVSTATRTVSGEDPVVPSRYDHSARRQGLIPEHEVSTATRTVSGEDPVVPSRYDHSARRRGLIPEHEVSTATRTVSGEDPVVPSRYDHSARRRGLIPEHEVSTATRTVSGEDPVVPSRYDHSARRRGLIPEHEASTATRAVSHT